MTKYYDIESTLDKYSDSPNATAFLKRVIEIADPDSFHWCDVEIARDLKKRDIKAGLL